MITAVKTDDKVSVTVISTHIGHKEDLRACHLNKDEKDEIAKKLASGVPVQRILHDIRDSYTNNVEKIHLTLRQDLHNIIYKYNINNKKSTSDYINTESLIHEMGDSVLFYKPQDIISEKYGLIDKKDFILIVMNEYQKHLLVRYVITFSLNCFKILRFLILIVHF